ncbi:MAG: M48 family metalloprotease [bacterium]
MTIIKSFFDSKIRLTISAIGILIFAFICTSCDDTEGFNIFSDADELQLGYDLSAEIESDQAEYPIYNGNPAVKSYIRTRIFDHILSSSKILKNDVFDYHIEIIDRDDVLNAFALPGGPIYVYTGLLKYLDSEAALAGILAHEIGHIEERHATERLTKYYGVSLLLSVVLGENPSELAEIAANLFVGLAFLANSRSDEDEADAHSFEYLQDTRYYPGGTKFFFEQLRDDGLVSSESSSIEIFLSTHPDPIERIQNFDDMLELNGIDVKTYKSNSQDFYKDEYVTNIKNKL